MVSLARTTTSCSRTLNLEPLRNTSSHEASTEVRPTMQAEPGCVQDTPSPLPQAAAIAAVLLRSKAV